MTPQPARPGGWRRFVRYHLPALLYAGLIIAVSAIPNLRSPEVRMVALDKLVHFLEYAIFAFLAFRAFAHLTMSIRANTAFLLTIFFVSLFAVFDEYFQSYIPGRHMDAMDLLMDIFGALLVATFFWLRRRRRERAEGGARDQFAP